MPNNLGRLGPRANRVRPGADSTVPGPIGPAGPTAISTDAGNRATLGSDSLIFVAPPLAHYARIRTTNESLNAAVPNGGLLQFDTVDSDTDGFAPQAASFDHIQIPLGSTGVYVLIATSSGSGNEATSLGMGLVINSSTLFSETNQLVNGPNSLSYTLDNNAIEILRFNEGDTIQLKNNSVSGGNDVFKSVFLALVRIGI